MHHIIYHIKYQILSYFIYLKKRKIKKISYLYPFVYIIYHIISNHTSYQISYPPLNFTRTALYNSVRHALVRRNASPINCLQILYKYCANVEQNLHNVLPKLKKPFRAKNGHIKKPKSHPSANKAAKCMSLFDSVNF